jgi:hypothetical protein
LQNDFWTWNEEDFSSTKTELGILIQRTGHSDSIIAKHPRPGHVAGTFAAISARQRHGSRTGHRQLLEVLRTSAVTRRWTCSLSRRTATGSFTAARARGYVVDPVALNRFTGPELDNHSLLSLPPNEGVGESKIWRILGKANEAD